MDRRIRIIAHLKRAAIRASDTDGAIVLNECGSPGFKRLLSLAYGECGQSRRESDVLLKMR